MGERESKELYQQWVSEYGDQLYRFAYRLMGARDQAEDLVQETFFHAWRSIHSLKEKSKARPWLFQIMRHRYSHTLRTRSRRPRTTGAIPMDTHVSQDQSSTLDQMARQEAIQRALDSIDDRYRIPFLMVFADGRTCRETADQLDLPLGTVLSRIHRARQTMRETLTQIGFDFDLDSAPPSTSSAYRLGGTA